jgi:hypothetical protein
VNVFRAPEGFLIALTYGRGSEWVRNVVAAGACQFETRGVQYRLSTPTIVHDPTRRRFAIPVQIVLRLIGANDFMQQRQGVAKPLHTFEDVARLLQVLAPSIVGSMMTIRLRSTSSGAAASPEMQTSAPHPE